MFRKETEFQKTEIGEFPKEWRVKKLKEIVIKAKAGGTPRRNISEYWNGNIPFVKIQDITRSNKYLYTSEEFITEKGLKNSNAWIVPKESLLLAIYGSLGSIAINKIPVATNQAIVGIIPNSSIIDTEFLYYWFLYFKPYWYKFIKKSTQPNLTLEIVLNSLVPTPPLEEQKRIANILSIIDSGIESVDRAIAKLERIKKALLNELLTGRIRVREENGKLTFYKETEFQDTEIGKIPKEWEIKRLGELLVFGHGKRPSELLPKGIVPVFGAGGLYGYTNTYMIDKPYVLILARVGVGSVGKVYLARGRVWVTDNAIYAYSRQTESVTAYVYYWLQFNRKLIEKHVKRSAGGYAILTLASLKNITIALPPQNEQKNIVETLNAVNNIIEIYEKEKERLLRVKKGLMDLLLTGKIRVIDRQEL
jgi:type I restriction enzyme S subunit